MGGKSINIRLDDPRIDILLEALKPYKKIQRSQVLSVSKQKSFNGVDIYLMLYGKYFTAVYFKVKGNKIVYVPQDQMDDITEMIKQLRM